jgi:hypothetical protein
MFVEADAEILRISLAPLVPDVRPNNRPPSNSRCGIGLIRMLGRSFDQGSNEADSGARSIDFDQ